MKSVLLSLSLRAAGVAALLPLTGTPAPDAAPQVAGGRALELAPGSGALSRAYRLPVVPSVPELPADVRGDPSVAVNTAERACPIEVRGIAWSRRGALAVLVAGDARASVHVGETVRLGSLRVSVEAIGRDHVIIRTGNGELRCELGD